MTCPNLDRQQLMAIAAADADLVWRPLVSGHLPANPESASGPVANAAMQRNANVLSSLIAHRCKGQTFRSNEARKRFLAVHQALAKHLSSEQPNR